MLARWATKRLQKQIAQVPAVVLLGARQVGKTTLAKIVAKGTNSIYLDLETPKDLLKLRDSASFLDNHSDKLVILDEPLTGLDAASEEQFCKLMNAHLDDDGIIVVATHVPLALNKAQSLELTGGS